MDRDVQLPASQPSKPYRFDNQMPSRSDLERQDSTLQTKDSEIPDGGAKAWTQTLLAHFVFFNTWGLINSFGVFQLYYSELLQASPASISWIGSIQIFLLCVIGVASGRATDGGYFILVFTLGVFLQLIGVFLASLCTTYWQILLSQGVCVGLGSGLTFCPAVAVLSSYFSKNRTFALGLAAAGTSTGGLVYPIIVDKLISHGATGFPWALRTQGFVMLITYLPCLVLFEPRLPPRRSGPLIDTTAFTDKPFIFSAMSMLFNFWGLYVAFFYIGAFGRTQLGMNKSINLIMVLNGVGVIGRIASGIVGDRWTGPLSIFLICSFLSGMLVFSWIAVRSAAGLYIFAVVYGIIAAAVQALLPAVSATMSPSPDKTGTRVGMIFSVISIGALTGPAIAGTLIEHHNGHYLYAQIFSACSILLGALWAGAARVTKAGWAWNVRV